MGAFGCIGGQIKSDLRLTAFADDHCSSCFFQCLFSFPRFIPLFSRLLACKWALNTHRQKTKVIQKSVSVLSSSEDGQSIWSIIYSSGLPKWLLGTLAKGYSGNSGQLAIAWPLSRNNGRSPRKQYMQSFASVYPPISFHWVYYPALWWFLIRSAKPPKNRPSPQLPLTEQLNQRSWCLTIFALFWRCFRYCPLFYDTAHNSPLLFIRFTYSSGLTTVDGCCMPNMQRPNMANRGALSTDTVPMFFDP